MAEEILDRRIYQPEQVIFREGDAANAAFMIRSGSVRIEKSGPNGPVLLVILKPNQAFGELALIDATPRSASAIANEMTELVIIQASKFQTKIDALDPFMRIWIQYLKHRILDLSAQVAE